MESGKSKFEKQSRTLFLGRFPIIIVFMRTLRFIKIGKHWRYYQNKQGIPDYIHIYHKPDHSKLKKKKNNITNLFSQRFALNRRWIVWSSNWDLLERYIDIICPTFVLLSGNRHNSAECPNPSKYVSSLLDCEVFPLRSKPSRTIKAPLFDSLLLPLKTDSWVFAAIRICLILHLLGNFSSNFDNFPNARAPKFLKRKKK